MPITKVEISNYQWVFERGCLRTRGTLRNSNSPNTGMSREAAELVLEIARVAKLPAFAITTPQTAGSTSELFEVQIEGRPGWDSYRDFVGIANKNGKLDLRDGDGNKIKPPAEWKCEPPSRKWWGLG